MAREVADGGPKQLWGKQPLPIEHLRWLRDDLDRVIAATELMEVANKRGAAHMSQHKSASEKAAAMHAGHISSKSLANEGDIVQADAATLKAAAQMLEQMGFAKVKDQKQGGEGWTYQVRAPFQRLRHGRPE